MEVWDLFFPSVKKTFFPGPDNIPYAFLKNVLPLALSIPSNIGQVMDKWVFQKTGVWQK